MKVRKLSMLFMMFGLLSLSAAAQTSGKVVKVKPGEDSYKIKRGASAQLSVVIDIDNGYHINSNRPSEAFLIGTALKVERMRGLTTSAIIYPKAKVQKFPFSEKPMSVYEGKAVLKFTARALPTLAAGSHTLKARVTLQACNNEACLRPQTIDVSIPVEIL